MQSGQNKIYFPRGHKKLKSFFDFSVLTIHENGKKLTFLSIFIPKLCELLFAKLIGTVNTLMISNYAENAVGATTSATQIVTISSLLVNIITVGCTIIISIELGRGDREQAARITGTGFITVTAISIMISILIFGLAEPFLRMINLEGDALAHGVTYLKIRGGLLFLSSISGYLGTVLICNGKALAVMISGIISNTLNALFVFLLLYVKIIPGISGTAAVAVATEIAVIAAIIYAAVVIFSLKLPIKMCFEGRYIKKIYGLGVPGSFASLSYNLAITLVVGFIGAIGIVSLNAYSFINTIISYVCITSAVVASCVSVFIGRYAGRGDITSIKNFLRIAISIAVLANGTLSLLAFIFRNKILSLFTVNEEIFKIAMTVLAIDFIIECFRGVINVLETSFNASRDVITTFAAGVTTSWGILVPVSYIFGVTLGFGLAGCWIGMAASEVAKATVYIIHYKRGKWIKKIK